MSGPAQRLVLRPRTKWSAGFWIKPYWPNRTTNVQRCVLVVVGGANRGLMVELATTRGWNVARTLEISSSQVRRGLEELRQLVHQGSVEGVVMDTIQLPGLSTMSVLRELAVMVELGIALMSVREAWLSTLGDQGKLISWVVASIDRDHKDKIRASLAKGRAEGRSIGRPRAVIPTEQVLRMRAIGASLRAIAKATGLGAATIHRFLTAHDHVAKAGKSRG